MTYWLLGLLLYGVLVVLIGGGVGKLLRRRRHEDTHDVAD